MILLFHRCSQRPAGVKEKRGAESANIPFIPRFRIGKAPRMDSLSDHGHYFSMSDILATQSRVPLTTKVELGQLGFLQSGGGDSGSALPAGQKLELPFWMVWALKGKGRVEVGVPKAWTAGQMDVIAADPTVVDLQRLGPHFYESGRRFLALGVEDADGVLVETLVKRFRNIMDASFNADTRDTLVNTETLDQVERDLYAKGQRSMKNMMKWSLRKTDNIKASSMVVKHRKRKADAMS